jgi:hypothetical protein
VQRYNFFMIYANNCAYFCINRHIFSCSGIGGLALRCPHAREDGYLRPSFTLSIVPALNAGINRQTCSPARTSINADAALAAFPLSSIASDLIRQSPTKSQKISPSLAYFKKKQYLCSRNDSRWGNVGGLVLLRKSQNGTLHDIKGVY